MTVPAKGTTTSDPIPFELLAGADVSVSFYAATATVYRNGGAQTNTWTINGADETATIDRQSLSIDSTRAHLYAVEQIDVVDGRPQFPPSR